MRWAMPHAFTGEIYGWERAGPTVPNHPVSSTVPIQVSLVMCYRSRDIKACARPRGNGADGHARQSGLGSVFGLHLTAEMVHRGPRNVLDENPF
jgi:hypothetical protein